MRPRIDLPADRGRPPANRSLRPRGKILFPREESLPLGEQRRRGSVEDPGPKEKSRRRAGKSLRLRETSLRLRESDFHARRSNLHRRRTILDPQGRTPCARETIPRRADEGLGRAPPILRRRGKSALARRTSLRLADEGLREGEPSRCRGEEGLRRAGRNRCGRGPVFRRSGASAGRRERRRARRAKGAARAWRSVGNGGTCPHRVAAILRTKKAPGAPGRLFTQPPKGQPATRTWCRWCTSSCSNPSRTGTYSKPRGRRPRSSRTCPLWYRK